MSLDDFLVRLGTALVCGTVIGVERQFYQRTGGLRTYALVSVGAALFVFVSVQAGDNGISRIVGQVVTGIGFLGAGIILHSGFNVRGLNGAAAIWCASAVGSLAGAGYLLEATSAHGDPNSAEMDSFRVGTLYEPPISLPLP